MTENIKTKQEDLLATNENIQNVSAALALLHGKSDSLCRLFRKEIFVAKKDLKALNDMIIEKLSLHKIDAITTTLDITFSNKRILTFKSWLEFESYDFEKINSPTKSVFIQWDFFASLDHFKVPQRHTVSVRISSTPKPSDFFKVLLSGGFDEAHDLDIQSCTMMCKVNFVNNTLAEELVNVVENWNDLCECAYSEKGKIRPFLMKHRNVCAHIFEICLTVSFSFIIAILIKLCIKKGILSITLDLLLYVSVFIIPIASLIKQISSMGGQWIYNAFGDLMETHVFKLSTGDNKEQQRIEKNSKFGKNLTAFLINAVFSIILSYVFFVLE